jgi:Ca-activated chloride channel family protein
MLYPPKRLEGLSRQPMELIFLMDCSGSMQGQPLEKAKAAASRALKRLGPGDAFQIIRFSDSATRVHRTLIPATTANVRRGLRDLERLESGGGTMMTKGIRAALGARQQPGRFRVVTLMTDGYIGNEAEVLQVMRRHLGSARIFSFGVGSSVNRYLMESMARLGRGAVAYVGLDEGSGHAVDRFYERVRHPALTDVSVDWGSLRVTDVYPRRIPDLFVGRPVIVIGRFEGEAPPFIVVQGRAAGEMVRKRIPIQPAATGEGHPGLPYVWARKKIAELNDAAIVAGDDSEFAGPIQQLALEYGLLSAHTAFVAVDTQTRTAGDHGVSVQVPVPVPQGVRYDTTVGR